MFAFVKERSDKKEDGSGWIVLRAKVLKPSTHFEFGFSNGLDVRLYWAVKLFVVASRFKENAPNEIRDMAYALTQILVPISP